MSLIGLDMYLRAQKYVSGWQHGTPEETNEYERLVEMFGMEAFITDASPSAFVEFTVGYWRKANHIHSWFVRECQKGRDECQVTNVSIDDLKDLREVCLRILASTKLVPGEYVTGWTSSKTGTVTNYETGKVLEDSELAEELLAPEEGFFFGSTDYTQYYWEDLEHTVAIVDLCERLSQGPGYWDFIYQSSW